MNIPGGRCDMCPDYYHCDLSGGCSAYPSTTLRPKDQRRVAANNLQPTHITIRNGEGQDVVKVNFDGTLEFGENYDPDEAARCFWEAIGNWVVSRDVLLDEATEALREIYPMAAGIKGHRLWPPDERLERAKALLDKLDK